MSMNPILARNMALCVDAERSLIGAVFLRGGDVLEVAGLQPFQFYDPRHHEIWKAMLSVHRQHLAVDPVTVESEMMRTGKWQSIGGLSFLSELIGAVPTADNAEHYATIVKRSHLSRRIVGVLSDILVCSEDGDDLLRYAFIKLAELEQETPIEAATLSSLIAKTYDDVVKRAENPAYGPKRIPTGFSGIDRVIGGVPIGVITVLAAPQNIGKSSLARDFLMNAVKSGRGPGLLISLEDSAHVVAERALAAESLVPNWKINHVALQRHEINAVSFAADKLYTVCKDFYVIDNIRSSADYCLMVRRMRKFGITYVVVDYLQNIDEPEAKGDDFRALNISLANFERLARDENIAVVLVSQVKRDRDAKIKAGDMRGSGRIEEKARCLMVLEREDDKNEATLSVLKNSHGKKGVIDLIFDGDSVSYRDVAREEYR